MKSVILKIKNIKSSTYVKIFPKGYTKMYFTKKSVLRAKHTVKQHLGMGGNLFSNQLEYKYVWCLLQKRFSVQ